MKPTIKYRLFAALVFAAIFSLHSPLPASAQDGAQIIVENCAPEVQEFCSTVRPGQARMAACIYAHADKISQVCYVSLFAVSRQLEQAMVSFRKAKFDCTSDLNQYCSKVPAGGGRKLDCLIKNRITLLDRCRKIVEQLRIR